MIISLDEEGSEFFNEARIIKEALRGRAQYYEEKAVEHNLSGYTAAGQLYLQRAWLVRGVLNREFGDV